MTKLDQVMAEWQSASLEIEVEPAFIVVSRCCDSHRFESDVRHIQRRYSPEPGFWVGFTGDDGVEEFA